MAGDWKKDLADDDFAIPGKRKLPIRNTPDDAQHTRMAWSMVAQTAGVSAEERTEARTRIMARATDLGLETKVWRGAIPVLSMQLEAMSLRCRTPRITPTRLRSPGS